LLPIKAAVWWQHCMVAFGDEKLFEPYYLEEGEVVTRYP